MFKKELGGGMFKKIGGGWGLGERGEGGIMWGLLVIIRWGNNVGWGYLLDVLKKIGWVGGVRRGVKCGRRMFKKNGGRWGGRKGGNNRGGVGGRGCNLNVSMNSLPIKKRSLSLAVNEACSLAGEG
ncbi:hypothetical protein DPMN_023085 [Dreissena polymorpha]|uniref:Uncharacterized protein n=1 Tax=Dreissena polymorpha TaxID=45954 RepID=A0A9D4LM77_DREPO|nr:hypothetical protein DPMN_023085 [Dreissena polymorpha]